MKITNDTYTKPRFMIVLLRFRAIFYAEGHDPAGGVAGCQPRDQAMKSALPPSHVRPELAEPAGKRTGMHHPLVAIPSASAGAEMTLR